MHARLGLLLAVPLLLHGLRPARADDLLRDIALGARIEEEMDPGDVHVFRLPLVAGTTISLDLEAEPEDKAQGLPELVVIDPSDTVVRTVQADGRDVDVLASVEGTWRLEVRAGGFEGEYEVRVEDETQEGPDVDESVRVEVAGPPVAAHVAAPAGSLVRIELRRRSGAEPVVVAMSDGLGRELVPARSRSRRGRVRLEEVPVPVEGGLTLTLASGDGGPALYDLEATIRSDTDRAEGGDDHESRRVVLRLAPGADAQQIATERGWRLVKVEDDGLAVFETPEGREGREHEDAEDAELEVEVVQAQPDLLGSMPEGSQSNVPVVGSLLGRSDVEQQQALLRMHAKAAQKLGTGAGIVVAVLDGGVDAGHEMLAGRTLPGRDFVDGDLAPDETRNGLDDDADGLVDEGWGHGTFVSSLVLCVAPDARILPVRVLDSDGHGRSSDIAAGIEWAATNGAHVINLSFGTLGGNPTVASAVRFALARGVAVVAATGNDARTTVLDFPATMRGVISVTAVDAAGAHPAFANGGLATTIAAPGTDIVGGYPEGQYATWSGTSFAAAFVSGGLALVEERAPGVTPARLQSILMRKAKPFTRAVPRPDRRYLGAGIVDLARLVR